MRRGYRASPHGLLDSNCMHCGDQHLIDWPTTTLHPYPGRIHKFQMVMWVCPATRNPCQARIGQIDYIVAHSLGAVLIPSLDWTIHDDVAVSVLGIGRNP